VAGNGLEGSSGDAGPATKAELRPGGLARDHAGNLVVTDTAGGLLRVLPRVSGSYYGRAMTAGHIYAIAGGGTSYPGDGGPATSGQLAHPQGLAVDSAGNMLIAEGFGNRVRMVAVKSGTYYGQQMTAGDIYTVAGDGGYYFRGDGGPATQAQINGPAGVALDSAGNLVVTDTGNNRVRVVAASTGTFYGQQMTAGYIYTVAGDGHKIFNGNGIPATQAGIYRPAGVTVDSQGNLLVTDSGNNRVQVVAEKTGIFYGRPMTAGDIYTVAGDGTQGFAGDGGPATMAEIYAPVGITVDGAGNLLVTDTGNNRVRVVAESTGTFYGRPMTAGHIYTVAGGGSSTLGDGGPATSAALSYPQNAMAGSGGSLLIADWGNGRVRMVSG
jgi:sugar lactone lactonase YvrE